MTVTGLRRGLALLLLPLLLAACGEGGQYQEVGVSVPLSVSSEQAWQKLSDFTAAHRYVPGIAGVDIVSEQTSGVGAERHVIDAGGDFLTETVVLWLPQQGFVMDLSDDGQPMAPFEAVQFSYELQRAGDGASEMRLAMRFIMPWGAAGNRIGQWLIAPFIEQELVAIAAGLKHYYDSGEPAGDLERDALAAEVNTAASGPFLWPAAPAD